MLCAISCAAQLTAFEVLREGCHVDAGKLVLPHQQTEVGRPILCMKCGKRGGADDQDAFQTVFYSGGGVVWCSECQQVRIHNPLYCAQQVNLCAVWVRCAICHQRAAFACNVALYLRFSILQMSAATDIYHYVAVGL